MLQAKRISFDPFILLVPRPAAILFSLKRISGLPELVVGPENDEVEKDIEGAGLETNAGLEGAEGKSEKKEEFPPPP